MSATCYNPTCLLSATTRWRYGTLPRLACAVHAGDLARTGAEMEDIIIEAEPVDGVGLTYLVRSLVARALGSVAVEPPPLAELSARVDLSLAEVTTKEGARAVAILVARRGAPQQQPEERAARVLDLGDPSYVPATRGRGRPSKQQGARGF